MARKATLKATQVMIAIQVDGDREAEIVETVKALVALCVFFWGVYRGTIRVATFITSWGILAADMAIRLAIQVIEAAVFGYLIATIRARSLCWGVLNL